MSAHGPLGSLTYADRGDATLVAPDLDGVLMPDGTALTGIGLFAALVGVLTPAGRVRKRTTRTLTGAVTPAGALAGLRVRLATLAGAITPANTLRWHVAKRLNGTLTVTGGFVRRKLKRAIKIAEGLGIIFGR